ncbi:hypothetical protein LIG30_3947 [Burkholderia sp. lig30]|jgi:hypothetical protein|uniref:hypothetical protein n=1 Tax=Burkholderia sp. lig30 TaxID=1192124 RepID=UPI0004619F1F|nr:hypothetical protein [Burkholderia sp. lig30]KDB06681.1 hypothetical protein LIG30_3947 [Burkholderia sp. lig30]
MSAARLNVRDATGGRRREPVVGGGSIKRLLAIAAFIAGGLATEFAHPVYCSTVSESRLRIWRKERRIHGRKD